MVEAGRVAEIIVELPDGTTVRGSGYRTDTTAVLTAAHVVENATDVRVRFDADTDTEWETAATCRWSNPGADLAVLSITPNGDELAPVRLGRLGDGDAVLPATAVGFPLWKLKNYDGTVITGDGRPRYRDTHQASGMVAALSNRREGTLEFTVTPPERDPDPDVSPWQGMSGAALWVGDRIVGVIARHHRTDGLGRLTAVRLVPGLPGLTEPLPDVIRPRVSDLVLTNYRKQVEAIAPENLLDREDELAELTRFVAGDEPYEWWQAGPWAGKSALMAWFVLHPPEGVDVVSFFVTGPLAAQEDCEAFTKELTLQLAALTGEHLPDVLALDSCQNQLWRLLDEAAERSRRLVLVIDGLDEDASAAHGKPSIASLLPRRLPGNVRVVLASRPDPQVPADVLDEDHPLLTCPRRQLAVSPHARSMERRAVNELNRQLTGDDLHRDVLGLITAAGGGLTRTDLEELTGRPPYEIDRLLDGLLGRTIGSRPAPLRPEENKPVHLFAHETLAQVAREKFGSAVRAYRARLHEWADSYRDQGWPPDTPQYLLLGYPHLLVDAGDHERLVGVATDRARHNRVLATSGGDALAASEVRLAQDVLRRQPAPDLSALVLLAAHGDELARRNSGIPERLPLVWLMLGEPARAEALARGITDLTARAHSLIALAAFAVETGDRERCHAIVTDTRALAHDIPGAYTHDQVLSELAALAISAGDPGLAFSILRDVREDRRQDELLARLARAVAGDHALALRFASAIRGHRERTDTLTELAWSAALAGEFEQAWSLLDGTVEPLDLVGTVAAFVRKAVAADEYEQARAFLNVVTHDHARTRGLATGARKAAEKREYEQALTFVRGIADPHERARAAIAVVEVVTGDGPLPFAAGTVVSEVEEIVQAAPNPSRRTSLLSRLAKTVARVDERARLDQPAHREQTMSEEALAVTAAVDGGDHEQALALVNGIADTRYRDSVLTELARAARREGDYERAWSWAWLITDADDQDLLLEGMASAAAHAGDHDQALFFVRHLQDPHVQDRVLNELSRKAADANDHELAGRWVSHLGGAHYRAGTQARLVQEATAAGRWHQAATILRAMSDAEWDRTYPLVDLATAMTTGGAADQALALVREVSRPDQLPDVLTRLAESVLSAGAPDRARALLTEITSVIDALPAHQDRSSSLAQAVGTAVAAGAHDQALALASAIADPYLRSRALTQLAEAAAATGEHSMACDLAVQVETLARTAANAALPAAVTALAVASLVVGEEERACRLAQGISDHVGRAHALATLVHYAPAGGSQTRRALLADAVAAANDIPDAATRAGALTELVGVTADQPDVLRSIIADAEDAIAAEVADVTRVRLLARLARAATAIGHQDTARASFAAAEALAGAMGGSDWQDVVRTELVTTATALGEFERAWALAKDATSSFVRRMTMVPLVRAANDAGHQDLALSIVLGVSDAVDRNQALTALVEHIAVAGDHARARSVAMTTSDPFTRDRLLGWLAEVATAHGDHELALSLVRDIAPGYQRNAAVIWLVGAAVATGDHARAEALVRELPPGERRRATQYVRGELPALSALHSSSASPGSSIDVLVAAGDRAAALTVARDITESYPRTSELTKLVAAEIAAGDLDRAVAVASEVAEPASRAAGLSTVVEAAAAGGDPALARSLLAEVLVLGEWRESVEVVARVAPDVLVPVLDELEARVRS